MDDSDVIWEKTYDETAKCPTKDRPFEGEDILFGHKGGYTNYEGCRNLRYFKGASMRPGLEADFLNGDVYYGPLCDGTEPESEEGVFCSGCNWTGKKATFTENQDCIEFYPKSIHIPKGKKMTIYKDCNFGGADVTYYEDQECLDTSSATFVQKGLEVTNKPASGNLKKNAKAEKALPENMTFKMEDAE